MRLRRCFFLNNPKHTPLSMMHKASHAPHALAPLPCMDKSKECVTSLNAYYHACLITCMHPYPWCLPHSSHACALALPILPCFTCCIHMLPISSINILATHNTQHLQHTISVTINLYNAQHIQHSTSVILNLSTKVSLSATVCLY